MAERGPTAGDAGTAIPTGGFVAAPPPGPPPSKTARPAKIEAVCPDVVVEERVAADGQPAPRRYTRGRFLGKGGFAVVYELREVVTGEVFAGKVRGPSARPRGRAARNPAGPDGSASPRSPAPGGGRRGPGETTGWGASFKLPTDR